MFCFGWLQWESTERIRYDNTVMKYFLVYTHGFSTEDYSALYSSLVIAKDKESAIEKYCADTQDVTPSDFGDECCEYGIQEMSPIM